MTIISPPASEPPTGTVTTFYNGDCPICRTEVNHYRRIDRDQALGLGWCDISQHPVAADRLGLNGETMKRRLHAVDEQGQLHSGIDAFILLWSRLPRFRWLSRMVALPLVRSAVGCTYENILAAALYAMTRRRERRRKSV